MGGGLPPYSRNVCGIPAACGVPLVANLCGPNSLYLCMFWPCSRPALGLAMRLFVPTVSLYFFFSAVHVDCCMLANNQVFQLSISVIMGGT